MTFAPTCFDSHRNHLQGAVQYLAKNCKYGSTVHVGKDVVNVMATCEPVCLCAMCTDHGAGRQVPVHIAHKHTGSHVCDVYRFTCCHNIDQVHADEHSRNVL
jgi:hypothetical protein